LQLKISRASLSVTAYMFSFGFFTILFGEERIIKIAGILGAAGLLSFFILTSNRLYINIYV
jgi:hypothetical protein